MEWGQERQRGLEGVAARSVFLAIFPLCFPSVIGLIFSYCDQTFSKSQRIELWAKFQVSD